MSEKPYYAQLMDMIHIEQESWKCGGRFEIRP